MGVSVNFHPERSVSVRAGAYPGGSNCNLEGLAYLCLEAGHDEIQIHGQRPASMIELGERIAVEGRKLLDAQKQAAIRTQLAQPLPDPFLPAALERPWTPEEVIRREA